MMKRYRLTLLFAATAVVAIAVAAVVVNLVVGNVAEDNLVKMAEDNTLREAIHVEALIRGRDALGGGTGAAPGESANVGSGSTSGPVTTLEEVVAYQNILDAIPSVAMGLNVVQISPNPPKDTDGRREDSGRGWVRELQGRWPGILG